MGKCCLYFKRLADLDTKVLEELIAGCVAETRRRYPVTASAWSGTRARTLLMTKVSAVRFVLAVLDLKRSTDYYTSVLGLSIDFEAPGWSFLSRGPFRVMLGECSDAIPPGDLGDHSYYGYITVSDVDALHEEYRNSGVQLTQALASKPWGMREFGIRTVDGHRLMFGQEL